MKKTYLYPRKGRTWESYKSMKARCNRPTDPFFRLYGKKGIKVCESWMFCFDNFVVDMGLRPEGKTLDRIDNSKGYYKENCRWATNYEQQRNKNNNVRFEYNGKNLTGAEWIEILKIPKGTFWTKIYRGITIKELVGA